MNLRVLVTAGPTREPLDAVRYLSNTSSGLQGTAIAAEAARRGWDVDLVHGPMESAIPDGVVPHPVGTADEMLQMCRKLHPESHVVVGVAAVCDYRPERTMPGKHKRDASAWEICLLPTEDILSDLGKRKGERLHVGFALETENLLANARKKLVEKNLDYIVANPSTAMGAEASHYQLLASDDSTRDLGFLTKVDLARVLCDVVEKAAHCRPGGK